MLVFYLPAIFISALLFGEGPELESLARVLFFPAAFVGAFLSRILARHLWPEISRSWRFPLSIVADAVRLVILAGLPSAVAFGVAIAFGLRSGILSSLGVVPDSARHPHWLFLFVAVAALVPAARLGWLIVGLGVREPGKSPRSDGPR